MSAEAVAMGVVVGLGVAALVAVGWQIADELRARRRLAARNGHPPRAGDAARRLNRGRAMPHHRARHT